MISDQILDYVLISALINTAVFLFTSYILFVRYGLPIYHIMGFYQLYHFLGFVLRPWELYVRGDSPTWDWIGGAPTGGTILWSTLVMICAHGAMIAGFVYTNPQFRPVASIPPINFRVGRPAIFALCILIFLALGAYGSYVSMGNVLQVDNEVARVEFDAAGGQHLTDVSGYQTMLAEMLTITLMTLFAVRRTRSLSLALIGLYIGYRTLAGAGRSAFVAVLLAISFIWLINQHRRLPTARMVVIAAAVLLTFNILGADRAAMRRVINNETTVSEVVTDYLGSDNQGGITQNMSEFDVLTALLSYVPDETGYTFGTQYLRIFIWPIPRFLWHDKPVFTSSINLLDYANFRVLTYTSYGDSYMTLGIGGMIIILFGISVLLNTTYRKVSLNPTPLRVLMYFIILSYGTILFRDGPVPAAYFYLVLGLGAFILVRLGGLRNDLPR